MSTNSSPQTGPSSRPQRSRPRVTLREQREYSEASAASEPSEHSDADGRGQARRPRGGVEKRKRLRQGNRTRRTQQLRGRPEKADAVPQTWSERIRHYLGFVLVPNAVLGLGAIALCFAVLLIGGWPLSYLPMAIGETWLVGHGVPFEFDGVTLGAVPLLPALGAIAIVAARVRAATAHRVSILDLGVLLALTLLIPLTLSGIALFMVSDASAVYPVSSPPAALALLLPPALHFIGFCFGLRTVLWRALAKRGGVPEVLIDAALTALNAIRNLALAGGVVALVMLALHYQRVGDLVAAYPNLGAAGGLWLTLLCLLYLPNAAVTSMAVLLGGSFDYAGVSTSLFASGNVALPPLPLLAAVPESVPAWAPVCMLIPAGVILASLWKVRPTLAQAGATGVWGGVIGLVLGVLTSGEAGAYGTVGPTAWKLGVLLLGWLAVLSLLVWAVAVFRSAKQDD